MFHLYPKTVGKQGRDESAELRKARAAIAVQGGRRRRWVLIAGAVIIVGLVVAIAVVGLNSSKGDKATPVSTAGPMVTPKGATTDGALVTGKADAPVTLDVYLDYMCPYCGQFERANGAEIARLVTDGTVHLKLHPLAFLDRASNGTQYSTRAANAIATTADRSPDSLLPFNNALYGNQPEEGSSGLTDAQIADVALKAGVPQSTVDAFDERIFVPWVTASTDAAFKSGITGTPTVKINGTQFTGDLYTVGPLTQAITEAAK
jgi:protein-disulfide isomerase